MMTTLSNSGSSSKHASPTKSRGNASPLLKQGGSFKKSRNQLNTSYMAPGEVSPNTSLTMTMKPVERKSLALTKSSSALNSSLNLGRTSSTNQTLFTPVRSKMLTSKKGTGSAAKNRQTSGAAHAATTASTTPGTASPVNELEERKEITKEQL